LKYQCHKTLEHENGKSHKMQACKGLGQLFIIPRQAAKATGPAETPLNDSALWQYHKAFFGCRQFDHFQLPVVDCGILGRLGIGVALINRSDFDGVPVTSCTLSANVLPRARSRALAAVMCKANRWPRVSTAIWSFHVALGATRHPLV
jgi:hypothetical protein